MQTFVQQFSIGLFLLSKPRFSVQHVTLLHGLQEFMKQMNWLDFDQLLQCTEEEQTTLLS